MISFPATTLVVLFGASTALAHYPASPAAGDACATACIAAYRTCQSNLSNPRSQCASDLATCVGYFPFDHGGSFVTPTACSTTVSAKPYTPTAPTTPTTVPTTPPTYGGGADACAANCVAAYRTCQSNLSNPRSQCASELITCVGYIPFDHSGSFVTPTACSATATATATASSSAAPKPSGGCASNCVAAYRTCQSNLSNPRSQCASELITCVGYVPFDHSGSFVTPTACSGTSAAPTQSKSTAVTPTQSHPAPTTPAPTTTGTSSACAQSCIAAFRTCQSNTSNPRSQCASELITCVGYNPFDNSGSFVTPTACSSIHPSKTANATASRPATYTGGAVLINAGGSFAAVAAGAVALMI